MKMVIKNIILSLSLGFFSFTASAATETVTFKVNGTAQQVSYVFHQKLSGIPAQCIRSIKYVVSHRPTTSNNIE